jgi:CBS domain-containing membrane protein
VPHLQDVTYPFPGPEKPSDAEEKIMSDANLDLDVDGADSTSGARVKVSSVWSFTRHEGDPVISRECSSYAEIDREISRLELELEDVRQRAAQHFGEAGAGTQPVADETQEGSAEQARGRMASLVDLIEGARVRDLMTKEVRTVAPNDHLSLADEMMRAGRFRHLVVCDDGEVVGVVSQRDIVLSGISWALGIGKSAHEKALDTCLVKEVMTASVKTVDPDAELQEAAKLMTSQKIGCLPVVAGGVLEGILTEGDFVATLTGQSR